MLAKSFRGNVSHEELKDELGKSGFKIDGDELYIYLNQLVKDGFVKEWNDTNGIGRYSILFSGVATDISGGYSHLQKETNRLRNLEEEDSFNKKFNSDKIHSTYISDDGFFMFNVENVGYVKDELRISGVIFVPDLVVKKRVIKGEIKGQIIVFNNTEVGLDFLKGKYDIFDFVNGLEYELDRFIDDLIISIKWNMDFN